MSLFQINKSIEYGLFLLTSMKGDILVSLNSISKEKHLSVKYLEQIATLLKKANILGSREGASGGYFLKNKKVNLLDIVEAIEGKQGLVNCVHNKCSMQKLCLQKNIWLKLQLVLEKELQRIKLIDLTS